MPSNTIVSVQTATAQFDEPLDRTRHGDEIIITVDGKPVAKLAPIRATRKPLPYGLLRGKLVMKAGFDDPLPNLIAEKQKSVHPLPPTLARPRPQRQRGRVKGIDDSALFEPLEAAEFTASDM
jgi:prevent-host-death family protein